MRYSTNILTSIIVFSTAVVANAQSYNSYYTPAPVQSNYGTNYGVTQTNYQYAQPVRSSTPCLTGNCPRPNSPTQYPYTSNANYGLSQACVNGQCNHPQHQLSQACVNGQCNHPQHQTSFNNIVANCRNGNCGLNCCQNGQCLTGQCTTGNCSTNRAFPNSYGAATPYNSQMQMNVSTVPNNSVRTIPVYGNQSFGSANNSPYYN